MIRCTRPGCARPAAYRLRAYRITPDGRTEPAGRSLELVGATEELCGAHADKLIRKIATVPGAKVEAERIALDADPEPTPEPTPQPTRRRWWRWIW